MIRFSTLLKPLNLAFITGFVLLNQATQATSFTNATTIQVLDGAPANLFPSPISVSGMSGTITSVSVTINNMSHDYVNDMSIILQAPSGQSLLLQSGVADGYAPVNITYSFSDAGSAQLSSTATFSNGTYKPTAYLWDIWSAGAPATPPPLGVGVYNVPGPFGAGLVTLSTFASTFNGLTPNGQWKLFVEDFSAGGDPGVISGGWTLNITSSAALPLGLNEFTALSSGNTASIHWSTLSTNTTIASFELERSISGGQFNTITSLNVSEANSYSYLDEALKNNTYGYRLKMINHEGNFTYSSVSSVIISENPTEILLNPNPSNTVTNLSIQTRENEQYSISIYDILGRAIYKTDAQVENETKVLSLPTDHLEVGNYIVLVSNGTTFKTLRFTKSK